MASRSWSASRRTQPVIGVEGQLLREERSVLSLFLRCPPQPLSTSYSPSYLNEKSQVFFPRGRRGEREREVDSVSPVGCALLLGSKTVSFRQ